MSGGDGATDYQVQLETTQGPVLVQVHPAWAPSGADRFRELVESGYYADIAFFRVLSGFVAQFGISGAPETSAAWRERTITDDPPKVSNTRGRLTFAMAGPNTRTTQLFINFRDNSRLDAMGFAPIAEVTEGMEHIDALFNGYGEGPPYGNGPDQARIQAEGNAYLRSDFPKLDYLVATSLLDA